MNENNDAELLDGSKCIRGVEIYLRILKWNNNILMVTFNLGVVLMALKADVGFILVFSSIPFFIVYFLNLWLGNAFLERRFVRCVDREQARLEGKS